MDVFVVRVWIKCVVGVLLNIVFFEFIVGDIVVFDMCCRVMFVVVDGIVGFGMIGIKVDVVFLIYCMVVVIVVVFDL